MKALHERFEKLATWVGNQSGRPSTVVVAGACIVVALVAGHFVGYGNAWTVFDGVVTAAMLLMMFVLQNTQNRDAKAMHLKMDEVLVALKEPDSALVDAEEMPEHQLDEEREKMRRRAKEQCNER